MHPARINVWGPLMTDSQPKGKHKRHEVMCRVLANSVVTQLAGSGCSFAQLLEFGGEVLACINRQSGGRGTAGDGNTGAGDDLHVVPYRLEPAADDRHTVHGPRVRLRPIEDGDAELLDAWSRDDLIRHTFSRGLLEELCGHASLASLRDGRRDFIVCDEQGRGIGLVCLFHIDTAVGQAEIAKLLGDPNARGKGYAKEATSLLLGYAFDELRLKRIYLRTAGLNIPNVRLNEKLGFRFEGILRQAAALDGNPVDVVIMSILAEEFLQHYRLEKG